MWIKGQEYSFPELDAFLLNIAMPKLALKNLFLLAEY